MEARSIMQMINDTQHNMQQLGPLVPAVDNIIKADAQLQLAASSPSSEHSITSSLKRQRQADQGPNSRAKISCKRRYCAKLACIKEQPRQLTYDSKSAKASAYNDPGRPHVPMVSHQLSSPYTAPYTSSQEVLQAGSTCPSATIFRKFTANKSNFKEIVHQFTGKPPAVYAIPPPASSSQYPSKNCHTACPFRYMNGPASMPVEHKTCCDFQLLANAVSQSVRTLEAISSYLQFHEGKQANSGAHDQYLQEDETTSCQYLQRSPAAVLEAFLKLLQVAEVAADKLNHINAKMSTTNVPGQSLITPFSHAEQNVRPSRAHHVLCPVKYPQIAAKTTLWSL